MKKKAKKSYRLSAVFWKEGRQVVGKCTELNVSSFGRNMEEARSRLEEAVDLYIENAKVLGLLDDVWEALLAEDRYTTIIEISA
jgi:predicted RNase H-like HicB family nuclease